MSYCILRGDKHSDLDSRIVLAPPWRFMSDVHPRLAAVCWEGEQIDENGVRKFVYCIAIAGDRVVKADGKGGANVVETLDEETCELVKPEKTRERGNSQ